MSIKLALSGVALRPKSQSLASGVSSPNKGIVASSSRNAQTLRGEVKREEKEDVKSRPVQTSKAHIDYRVETP